MTKPCSFFTLLLVWAFGLPASLSSQTLLIQAVADGVRLDSLRLHIRILADDTTFRSGDSTYRITGRMDSTGRKLARLYLKPKFDAIGLAARLDTFGVANEYEIANVNIFAEQPGVLEPAVKVIIGAHYDAIKSGVGIAPGADDNASGCAVVLEAARVLSRYKTRYTVLYALWDSEERGRLGSTKYVLQARSRGDSIRGYINIDQIGWDSVQTAGGEIWVRPYGQSRALGDSLMALAQRVQTGIIMHRIDPVLLGSDHTSFWLKGYSAVSLAEEFNVYNNSPYGHTVNDRVEHINFTSLCGRARFAAAAIAWLAGIEGTASVEGKERSPEEFTLHQNYPNPFNPTTTIRYSLPHRVPVTLAVFNMLGQRVAELVNGSIEAGHHEVRFSADNLAAGIYFCRLQAGPFTQVRLMALVR